MIIWGKIAGAIFGYSMGGFTGLIIGVLIGHYLDNGLKRAFQYDQFGFNYRPGNQEQIQTTFFTAVFSVMGHIAKADGRVSESEITLARNIMRQMQLDATQEKTAIDLSLKRLTVCRTKTLRGRSKYATSNTNRWILKKLFYRWI